MQRASPVEQDEFLAAAPLFRHGPWLLMAAGLMLCAAALAAVLWRIDVGRRGEYDKAFNLASATVTAVRSTTTQVFALLQHTTRSLRATASMPDSRFALRGQLDASFGFEDRRIRMLLVDDLGEVHAAGRSVPLDPPAAERIGQALRGVPLNQPWVLPEMPLDGESGLYLVVVEPLSINGVSAVAYVVDATLLTEVFRSALDGKAAWLQLSDKQGMAVAQVRQGVAPADTDGTAVARAARSTREAMATPADYGSSRLLLARDDSPDIPLDVTVGLNEAGMLEEMHQRVRATWLIFGVAMFVVMCLMSLTSLALRKFAIKEAYLRRLATIDILTGLPNRRSFHYLLDKAVRLARRKRQVFGLMFVDLDNFKDVNDSMGHEAGDELLRHVGQVLLQAVRQGDRVCRLGGDEFTVLLGNLGSAEEARCIGQRILDMLAQPHGIGGLEVRTHATIGIALMPQHASSVSDLMRFADTAMYRAKLDGKRICLLYDESMEAQALFKAQRARELAYAIAHDELFLEYQPKFCMQSARVTGYEALVRWRHPQRGLIGPVEFISLAEEAGLIVDLGHWVLERAVRQLREWHDLGAPWQHMAINVSALQLRNGRFAAGVRDVLARHGVSGRQLQLELTESSLVVDAQQARELVNQVHEMGIGVAVDDFGTGYSSLAALQHFNIDCLKIDRAFVHSIETHRGEQICKAVVSLARGLHMRSVAEGVETQAQRDILERLGCDEVQGFLYARPLAAAEVLRRTLQTDKASALPA